MPNNCNQLNTSCNRLLQLRPDVLRWWRLCALARLGCRGLPGRGRGGGARDAVRWCPSPATVQFVASLWASFLQCSSPWLLTVLCHTSLKHSASTCDSSLGVVQFRRNLVGSWCVAESVNPRACVHLPQPVLQRDAIVGQADTGRNHRRHRDVQELPANQRSPTVPSSTFDSQRGISFVQT